MITIYCKKCGIQLSKTLEKLENVLLVTKEPKKEFLPKGYYYLMDDLESDEKLQSYIINLKDLMNTSAPLGNGCCGQDGMDGLNTTCIHGHKIGTENSDCWMPHSFVFDKSCI